MEIYELLERYLSGEMTGEERASFERRLAADDALADALARYREVREQLALSFRREEEAAALVHTLEEAGAEHFQDERKPARLVAFHRRRWLAIAGIAAAIAVAVLIWQPWQAPLAVRYGQLPRADFGERSGAGDADLAAAGDAFNRGDYRQALLAFEAYLARPGRPGEAEVRLFAGLCHLELGQREAARSFFSDLYEGPSAFRYDAAWFMALAWLREDNRAEARRWLERIPEGTDHYQDAEALREEL